MDDSCLFFQTGWGTSLEDGGWEVPPGPDDREGPYLRRRRGAGGYCEVVNTETDSVPPLAHFNGRKTEFVPAEEFCFGNLDAQGRELFARRLEWYKGLYPKIGEVCPYAGGKGFPKEPPPPGPPPTAGSASGQL